MTETDIRNQVFYLWMVAEDLAQARDCLNRLLTHYPDEVDQRVASIEHRALDTAMIISYGRVFKKNRGFGDLSSLIQEMESLFTSDQLALHAELLSARDQQHAHSDAEVSDFQFYDNDLFKMSRRVIRHPVPHSKLRQLRDMIAPLNEFAVRRRDTLLTTLRDRS